MILQRCLLYHWPHSQGWRAKFRLTLKKHFVTSLLLALLQLFCFNLKVFKCFVTSTSIVAAFIFCTSGFFVITEDPQEVFREGKDCSPAVSLSHSSGKNHPSAQSAVKLQSSGLTLSVNSSYKTAAHSYLTLTLIVHHFNIILVKSYFYPTQSLHFCLKTMIPKHSLLNPTLKNKIWRVVSLESTTLSRWGRTLRVIAKFKPCRYGSSTVLCSRKLMKFSYAVKVFCFGNNQLCCCNSRDTLAVIDGRRGDPSAAKEYQIQHGIFTITSLERQVFW